MSLEIINQLNVDFHDSKYLSVNAKQYDRASRFISISCYNQGNLIFIDNINNYAYIRYRKPDDLGVFNSCDITDDGKVLVELSEQMLAVSGKCYADLVVVNNNPVDINENTGELVIDDNDRIVSTMTFCINVIETAFDNTEIESSYEYNALNELIIKVTEDYTYVMKACKISEDNAKISETNAKISENNAKSSEVKALESETNAKAAEQNTILLEANTKILSELATAQAELAEAKATEASQYATDAANTLNSVNSKASEISNSATLAQSYAIGGTNTRTDENTDNAKYYYTQTKIINDSIGGAFRPKGTIEFAQLQSVEKDTGYVYHITDDFITDDTFKGEIGTAHEAGTNVYYTVDGYWDCFINRVSTDDVELLQATVASLQERIKVLEEQVVLEIIE